MNKKVSVILPSLNAADSIEKCLQSILNQTLKEIEILCVDAGSTDGTCELLEKYAEADPRIRIVHSEQKSYGYQVNLGIELSQGKYIGIVESDDYIEKDMYEILCRNAGCPMPGTEFGRDITVVLSRWRKNRRPCCIPTTLISGTAYTAGIF